MDQAKSTNQTILWDLRKCGEVADLDCGVGLRVGRHHPEAAEAGGVALHIDAGLFGDSIRKSADRICGFWNAVQFRVHHGR
jgi:hypothetical protein